MTDTRTDTTTGALPAAPPAVSGHGARTDLLALTPDTLAALSNRGLVKRATKDLDAGAVPALTTDPDGTVRARFDDGTTAALPSGAGLDNGACTCAAPGVCRHLVTLILGYRRTAVPETGGTGPKDPGWSPGSTDDAALTAAFGSRSLAAARRTCERGFGARVHRATAQRPEQWVELPTCTVRFPVAGEIAYALTDAAATVRGEMVALAVWAFRAADEAYGDSRAEATVRVGGSATVRPPSLSGLDTAADLADELLLAGVAHAGPVLGAALGRTAEALVAGSLHWPAGAVDELAGQLSAYALRDALYRPELVASLIAEIHARRRAAALPGVLGTQESGVTPLRRVRLTSLGCRVGPAPRAGSAGAVAEVYFAHPGAATVLVLRKEWPVPDDEAMTGHRLAARRLLGTTLGPLATGSLVSENARRTASRALMISGSRLGTTSVTPVGASWAELPEPLLVRDVAGLAAARHGRPPRMIRPRVEAEAVHVIALSEVEHVGYDPAEQRLEALVRDEAGTRATVSSGYRPGCPGALDALADALEAGATHLSGSVHPSGGGIRIDPIAVLTPAGVVVPDLAPGDGSTALASVIRRTPDPLGAVLDGAGAALAAVAHSGLRRLAAPARARIDASATALSRAGLTRAAALLRAFLDTPADAGGEGEAARCAAWLEAQLHIEVAAELRSAEDSP